MNAAASISLCIIARNEAHCLARCLGSAQNLVDEIIVVDTGSTDDTAVIAAEYGAAVYNFDWIDDFAAARNYAISKARGEWILILDADEALRPLSRAALTNFIKQSPAEGYYFRICSYLDHAAVTVDDYVVRLFKNAPQYRFAGAIHEQVAGSIQRSASGSALAFAPFIIDHYGYSAKEVAAKRKFDRNTAIIAKALGESPQDPFLHYSMGIEYLQNKKFRQAEAELAQAVTLLHGEEGYIPQLLLALLLVKLRQPGEDACEELFRKAILTLPENGDIYCLYGVWLMQRRRFAEAAAVLEKAVAKKRELIECGQLNALLGDACLLAGMNEKAAGYYVNALCSGERAMALHSLKQMLILWVSGFPLLTEETLRQILTPEITASLLQQTQEAGMPELTLAAALLAVIERQQAGDVTALMECSSAYCRMLKAAMPAKPLQTDSYAILAAGAKELLLQGRLLQLSGGHSRDIAQALLDNARGQLVLLAYLICEFSTGDPLLFWQGVFWGETCTDCQPD